MQTVTLDDLGRFLLGCRALVYTLEQLQGLVLANVNSCSRSLYAVARPSVVCRLSVTLVHPTQAVVIFGNFSTAFGTLAIL